LSGRDYLFRSAELLFKTTIAAGCYDGSGGTVGQQAPSPENALAVIVRGGLSTSSLIARVRRPASFGSGLGFQRRVKAKLPSDFK
jgi:hypothetical protein